MASFSCAAYQAGSIHGNLKKVQEQRRTRCHSEGSFIKAPTFSLSPTSTPTTPASSSCDSSAQSSPRGSFGAMNFQFQLPSLNLRTRASTWSDTSDRTKPAPEH